MEQSLEMLSKEMVSATKQFAIDYHVDNMKQVMLNTQSSTVVIKSNDDIERKFAVVFFGIQDEDEIFYWADSISEFSEYTRGNCAEVRKRLEQLMLLESTHYSLNVSNAAIMEARELDMDGGRYVIDENDSLLSRYSIDELLSIVFSTLTVKGVYTIQGDHLNYYFGVVSPLS
jgi:hypothetical protein